MLFIPLGYKQIDVNQQHAKAKVLLSEELHAG